LVKSNLLHGEIAERTVAAVDAHFEELVMHVQHLAEARANAEGDDGTPEQENEITPPAPEPTPVA